MNFKNTIEHVLRNNSIIEFLSKRGHEPIKSVGNGRYKYFCPFPDHTEKDPSFIVFTNAEYDNFYCFGCNRSHTIIHLIAYLDGISFYDALNRLSDGITITSEDDVKMTLERIRKEQTTMGNPISDIEETMLQISTQCFLFSQGVEFDEKEMYIIDGYYSYLDKQISNAEFESIEESQKLLPIILKKRKSIFLNEKKKKKFSFIN